MNMAVSVLPDMSQILKLIINRATSQKNSPPISLFCLNSNASAFIVFSPDSTQLELFFSNNQPNEILERRGLPSGGYAWNVEDDDTKNVRLIDGLWTISQRNKLIYSQKAGN